MTTIVADNFNRADSTTVIGTATTGHTWVSQTPSAVWGISGNKAYQSDPTATSVWDAITVDSRAADCSVSLDMDGSVNSGLVFRLTDDANYWLFLGNGYLYKKVANAFTLVAGPFTTAVGTVTAVLLGSFIDIRQSGASILSATDSFNSTATKHGLGSYHDPLRLFDNFLVTTGAPPQSLIRPFALRRSTNY